MFRWFIALLDRVFAVIGALVFLQAPQFFQQYSHRLAGHIDELRFHIFAIQQAAERSGKGVLEYVEKFLQQVDQDFVAQGKVMQGMLERHAELTKALLALREASPLSRPYYFVKYFNGDVVQATLKDFQPGLMLTFEGIVYAAIGVILGICLYHFILLLISRLLISVEFLINKAR